MITYSATLNALILEGDNDSFVFEPESDLTPAQLALALAPLLTGRAELVGALHPLIQRHFRRMDRVPRDAPTRMNTVAPDARMGAPVERLEELAAITGVPLTEGWTLIGLVDWPNAPDGYEIGLCHRALPPQGERQKVKE